MKKIIIMLMSLCPIIASAQLLDNVPASVNTDSLELTIGRIEELKRKLAQLDNQNPFLMPLNSPLEDSLSFARDSLRNEIRTLRKKINIFRNKFTDDHHYHIYKAGKYIHKAYALEIGTLGFGIVSGVCLAKGYSNDKKSLKAMGYLFGAGGVVSAISALTFHFKSGDELKLGAGKITYVL